MNVRKVVTSVITTLLVTNMLIVGASLLPLHRHAATRVHTSAGTGETVQQAGLFGCIWACMKCVGTIGKNGKACRKCAGCLGDDSPDEPADDR